MRHFVALAVVALTLACDRSTACTLIGCDSDLTVEIQNAPPGPITVQVTPPGPPGPVHTATCPDTSGCTVRFGAFAPGRTRFTVTTTAGTRRWELTPSYTTSQPNGPKCGPICRHAAVRIAWQ
jgi:hypothetical protein